MGLLQEVAVTHAAVTFPGGKKGKVRGLSLIDVGELMKSHLKELSQIFEGRVSIEEVATRWPVFAAKIIAVGMDEPDDWEAAQKLNITTQLDVLMKIWDLTILDEDVLKKVWGRLEGFLNRQAVQALPELKKPTGKPTSSKPQKT